MARIGTKPTADKLNFTSQPSVPANQKLSAAEYNYLASKANAPGLNDAYSTVIKFDDNYFPDPHTMTGNEEYTIDHTDAGTGNGSKYTVIGNGGTLTFTGFTIKDSSLTPSSNVVTTANGTEYNILFLRVGSVSEVYIKTNSLTGTAPTPPPTVISSTVENADPDALVVLFSKIVTITDTTGLSLDGSWAGITLTGVTGSGTNTLTFAMSGPAAAGESGNFVYGGTNNIIDGSSNALAASSTAITNNVSAIDNPTITSMSVEDGAATSVIVNFNQNVNITNQTGWTFRINAAGDTLTGVSGSGTAQLTFTCTTAVVNGDTLDISYDSGTGNCVATDDSAPLQSFTQTSVTNNIAGAGIILLNDDFANASVWAEQTDPNGTISKTSSLLTLGVDGVNNTSRFGLYTISGFTSANDLIIVQSKYTQPNFAVIQGRYGLSATQGEDENDKVFIGNRTVTTLDEYRLVALDGGAVELNENTGQATGIDTRIKYVPSTGAITFEYWNGAAWASLGTSANVDLGTTVYVFLLASQSVSGSANQVTYQNLYITDDDYSTQYPT